MRDGIKSKPSKATGDQSYLWLGKFTGLGAVTFPRDTMRRPGLCCIKTWSDQADKHAWHADPKQGMQIRACGYWHCMEALGSSTDSPRANGLVRHPGESY